MPLLDQSPPTAAKINGAGGPPPGYERYPLTMVHPNYRPAEHHAVPGTQIYNQRGEVVSQDYQGTAVYCPPVTAGNENEEARLAADGYVPAGQVDPSAWVRAHSSAPGDVYVPQKYPMWRDGVLYKTASEDPEASEEDLKPREQAIPPAAAPVQPASGDNNLAAQMADMQQVMRQMSETMQALAAENKALKESAEAAPAPKKAGRPRQK
jgi:hypothetical protein